MSNMSDILMTWVPVALMGISGWVGYRHGYRRGQATR
jgi:hypothetical protein